MDKDVRRTDKAHPFFAGERNSHQKALRRILLTYAMYNFDLGYCQVWHCVFLTVSVKSMDLLECCSLAAIPSTHTGSMPAVFVRGCKVCWTLCAFTSLRSRPCLPSSVQHTSVPSSQASLGLAKARGSQATLMPVAAMRCWPVRLQAASKQAKRRQVCGLVDLQLCAAVLRAVLLRAAGNVGPGCPHSVRGQRGGGSVLVLQEPDGHTGGQLPA